MLTRVPRRFAAVGYSPMERAEFYQTGRLALFGTDFEASASASGPIAVGQ
jgi:hypothetical protein